MSNKTKLEDGGAAFPISLDPEIIASADDPITLAIRTRGLSVRDYACIHLQVPETDKEWLNEIIKKAKRDEFAKAALQGMVRENHSLRFKPEDDANWCYTVANEMLKESEEENATDNKI